MGGEGPGWGRIQRARVKTGGGGKATTGCATSGRKTGVFTRESDILRGEGLFGDVFT